MANPVLHIKDSYYFELPKFLVPANYHSLQDFPPVWVSLDDEYQDWHFDRVYDALAETPHVMLPPAYKERAREEWHRWQHESHDNFGKPFDEYLQTLHDQLASEYGEWSKKPANQGISVADMPKYRRYESLTNELYWSFYQWRHTDGRAWKEIRRQANNVDVYKDYCEKNKIEWNSKKIEAYNYHLSGKVLIPQPFGKLRNLYEAHPANHWYELCISKFMVIEIVVAILIGWAFIWLARRVKTGAAPKGKLWNLLETFVVFIRDQVAEPSVGHHDAHRYVPFLWSIFFFVLGCNLMGMLPWLGSPTGTLGVTLALATITFLCVLIGGSQRFGVFGFFKNLVPHMDLPLIMAIFIKPMLFVIEIFGLLIKHAVLSVRLLANIMAGHLVLLTIMGIAFSVEAATSMANWQWAIAAPISVVGSATLSLLELFVAFLQAYIFTFLSALFIGAALHEH